ncbi:uncharacterized protein LOC127847857 [Dreissena polymorpha]|nr:uncharacterized protein LOC127847857 [Dreissena polymorpha]
MSLQIRLSIIAWLAMVIRPSLEVILDKKKEEIHLPIECSFNGDISFKFTSKLSKKTQTIAACSTTINSCYLSDQLLAQRYAISKSNVGGELLIIEVSENSFGTYTCYETYNSTNSAAVDVGANDLDTSRCAAACTVVEANSSSSIGLILAGVQTLLLIACIACVIFRVNCKAFCTKRKELETEDTSDDFTKIDCEDELLKDSRAKHVSYDGIQLDSENFYMAAVPLVQTSYKTNETNMLMQSKSVPTDPYLQYKYTTHETHKLTQPQRVPLAADPPIRHPYFSTNTTTKTSSRSVNHRLANSRAGMPHRSQNNRFNV